MLGVRTAQFPETHWRGLDDLEGLSETWVESLKWVCIGLAQFGIKVAWVRREGLQIWRDEASAVQGGFLVKAA